MAKFVQSKRFQLNKQDLSKIGKGLLIAAVGAILTYVTDMIPNVDFGEWTPVVVAAWSVIANTVRKLLAN